MEMIDWLVTNTTMCFCGVLKPRPQLDGDRWQRSLAAIVAARRGLVLAIAASDPHSPSSWGLSIGFVTREIDWWHPFYD